MRRSLALRTTAARRLTLRPKDPTMTARLTRKVVTFQHPFYLDELDDELPAGPYSVETEEERLDGATFYAYRRVSTTFVVRPTETSRRTRNKYITIDPSSLEAAIERDIIQAAAQQTLSNHQMNVLCAARPADIINLPPPANLPLQENQN